MIRNQHTRMHYFLAEASFIIAIISYLFHEFLDSYLIPLVVSDWFSPPACSSSAPRLYTSFNHICRSRSVLLTKILMCFFLALLLGHEKIYLQSPSLHSVRIVSFISHHESCNKRAIAIFEILMYIFFLIPMVNE